MQLLTRKVDTAIKVTAPSRQYSGWILAAITLLAFALRAWGLNFGLPSLYHPDEPTHVAIIEHIIKTGDLNPHFFDYPSLFFYIHVLAYLPYYLFGQLLGIFHSTADIPAPVVYQLGVGTTALPSTFLVGRWLTVLFGVATVPLVYMAGKELFGRRDVALLAAFLTAVSPANVANSRFITPNMMLTFFGVLALLGAVRVLKRGATRDYVLAGVGVGLTASLKYNGALIIVTLASAHFLHLGIPKGLRDWRIYMAPLLGAALFFATTPYAILDSTKFLHDVQADAQHYATAHFGMQGDAFGWYVDYLWSVEGLIVLPALLEIARGIITRSKPIIMLSAFPIIYFIFISTFVVRNDRTLMPVLPSEALLGSAFLFQAISWFRSTRLRSYALRRVGVGLLALAMFVAAAYPLQQSVARSVQSQHGVETRDEAAAWINSQLERGAHIAAEAYSPVIDVARFHVDWIEILGDHDAAWYSQQGYNYVVFSGGIFNRFYREPALYAGEVAHYDALFAALQPIRTFYDDVYEIRVYRVPR